MENGSWKPVTGRRTPAERELIRLAVEGDAKEIGAWLKEHPSARQPVLDVALLRAARAQNTPAMETLVPPADINMGDGDILRHAVEHNHVEVMGIAGSIGGDVRQHNNHALMYAARHGFDRMINALVLMKVDVAVQGGEAIRQALIGGHPRTARHLLSEILGDSLNQRDAVAWAESLPNPKLAALIGEMDFVEGETFDSGIFENEDGIDEAF